MLNKALRALLTPQIAQLLCWIFLSQCSSGQLDTPPGFRDLPFSFTPDATVEFLTVNQQPVVQKELLLCAQINRPEVLRRFRASDGNDSGFWDQSFKNVTPRDDLLRRTLVTCVEVKIRLLMAREFGIRGEVDFENVERRWQVENLRRREAVERGDEVFGPAEYTLLEYVKNDLRSLDVALMQRLEEKDLLKTVDSIWDRPPGEARLERMKRLYRTYLSGEVEKSTVRINQEKVLSLDLVAVESALQEL